MPIPIIVPSTAGKYTAPVEIDAIICRLRPTGAPPPGAVELSGGDWLIGYSRRCTHMGCVLLPRPAAGAEADLPDAAGRVICPCHASCFDLARQGMVVIGPATDWLPMVNLVGDPPAIPDDEQWRRDDGVVPYGVPYGGTTARPNG